MEETEETKAESKPSPSDVTKPEKEAEKPTEEKKDKEKDDKEEEEEAGEYEEDFDTECEDGEWVDYEPEDEAIDEETTLAPEFYESGGSTIESESTLVSEDFMVSDDSSAYTAQSSDLSSPETGSGETEITDSSKSSEMLSTDSLSSSSEGSGESSETPSGTTSSDGLTPTSEGTTSSSEDLGSSSAVTEEESSPSGETESSLSMSSLTEMLSSVVSTTLSAISESSFFTTEMTDESTTDISTITTDTETTDTGTTDTETTDSQTTDTETTDTQTTDTPTTETDSTESFLTTIITYTPTDVESTSDFTTDLSTEFTSDSTTDSSTTETGSESTDTEETSESSTTSGSTIEESSSPSGSTTEISEGSSSTGESEGSTTSSFSGSTTEMESSTMESSSEATSEVSGLTTDSSATSEEVSGSTTEEVSGSSEASSESGGTTEAYSSTDTSEGSSVSTEISEGSSESETTSEFDVWSSSTEGDLWETTPVTDIFLRKMRKCRRKKKPDCKTSKHGCCIDQITPAKGPFNKGCPDVKTCNETTYGCCEDGVSVAKGKNFKGCPPTHCEQSLFGCCPDKKTPAEGTNKEGCPPPPPKCLKSKFGCCPDNVTEAKDAHGKGCKREEKEEEGVTTTMVPTEEPGPCNESTYGCCPDGVETAQGEDYEGCDIFSENCTESYFGCCPDGTSAKGPNYKGCKMECESSAYGCCEDSITPAHGYNKEGCCLITSYGCCPDNIIPAQGPNLEGCGCQYSPYGCCPDNSTAARGYNNEGCGCQYTEFGCCPDSYTPAAGAEYQGCQCHTFQFGCCPDGVTAAKGPHKQGCGCQNTEFGCCSDDQTPAKGPNYEGCGCDSTKYGCCLDGVTEATGENFEGCDEVLTKLQDSCTLRKERGSCRNYTVKWFFDMEYGGCSRFWYGGCEGNENRFRTRDECQEICVEPQGTDRCLLPKVAGPCEGYYPMWYYDTERKQCAQFIYGGCLGNNNRFETREECSELCVRDDSVDACEQPKEEGPCRGHYRRWYFSKESQTCEQFRYGGCKANNNNFPTEDACKQRCSEPGRKKANVNVGQPQPQPPNDCQRFSDECSSLLCEYGWEEFVDEETACRRCRCHDPCRDVQCEEGTRCAVDLNVNRTVEDDRNFIPTCRPVNKEGTCPQLSGEGARCDQECRDDADCSVDLKCCSTGCGTSCLAPHSPGFEVPAELVTTGYSNLPAYTQSPIQAGYYPPVIEEETFEPEVTAGEGDYATLKCSVRGNPNPDITWKKGNLLIDGSQPRFRILLDGVLQIITLHKTDSGVYLCIAKNNMGEVQREIKLDVTDGVAHPTSIINDEKSDVVVALGSKAVLNCYAIGYPIPFVTWWKDNNLVPMHTNEFAGGTGDFSLLIQSVQLSNLGVYTCQAYNGIGKATSWAVTVQALGPVYSTRPEDEQYMKYVIPAPEPSTTTERPRFQRPVYYPRPIPTPEPYIPPPYEEPSPDITGNDIAPQLPPVMEPSQGYTVPVRTNVTSEKQHFPLGSDVTLNCNVEGYPVPQVQWYKDGQPIQQTDKLYISDNHVLYIRGIDQNDTGDYACEAVNQFSRSRSTLKITVEGLNLHPNCTDNQFFANCQLIVRAKYCSHKYYARFCCKSCTQAGLLPVYGPHLFTNDKQTALRSNLVRRK
ncbi:papilin-like [Agrilus planipennis]|uniref:Papilin-like n=1 Tax=Agrilus planipennis TaxID=224129 RepID=A0A7F5RFD9_AGRPL|nr:papilin-like [Agrilus planipennis]